MLEGPSNSLTETSKMLLFEISRWVGKKLRIRLKTSCNNKNRYFKIIIKLNYKILQHFQILQKKLWTYN